jgi:hypothetical protein
VCFATQDDTIWESDAENGLTTLLHRVRHVRCVGPDALDESPHRLLYILEGDLFVLVDIDGGEVRSPRRRGTVDDLKVRHWWLTDERPIGFGTPKL